MQTEIGLVTVSRDHYATDQRTGKNDLPEHCRSVNILNFKPSPNPGVASC